MQIPGVPQTKESKPILEGEGFSALLASLMGNKEGIETIEIVGNFETEGEEQEAKLPFPVAIPFNLVNFKNYPNNEVSVELNQAEIPMEISIEIPNETINLVEEGEGQSITTIIPKEEVIPKEVSKTSFVSELQNTPLEVKTLADEKTPIEEKITLGEEIRQPLLNEKDTSKKEQSNVFKTEVFNIQTETKEIQNSGFQVQEKPIDPEIVAKENIQRLNDSIIKLIDTTTVDNKSVMKVKLYPEELGTLDLTLEMQEGKLVAKIMVDNESVKQLFTDKLGELNQNLVKQNINVQDFKVEVKPEASLDFNDFNSHGEFNQDNREQPRRNRIFGHKEIMPEDTLIEITSTSGELSVLA